MLVKERARTRSHLQQGLLGPFPIPTSDVAERGGDLKEEVQRAMCSPQQLPNKHLDEVRSLEEPKAGVGLPPKETGRLK